MEDKHLDRVLKEKLENLQEPLLPEAWDLFEQKLDQVGVGTPNANEQLLDQTVFNKLHRIEANYEPAHWNMMASKLDQEFYFHHRILRYKVTEFALLFLLVFALATYLPVDTIESFETPNKEVPEQNLRTKEIKPSTQPPVQALQTPGVESEPTKETTITYAEEAGTGKQLSRIATIPTLKESVISITKPSRADITVVPPVVSGPGFQYYPQESLNAISGIVPTTLDRAIEPTGYIRNLIAHSLASNSYFSSSTGLLTSLGKKTVDPLEYSIKKIDVETKLKKKSYFRLGTITNLDYNRVTTPSDPEENIEGFQRYALGYGGGITIGFLRGRFELETGISYYAKQYRAVPVLFIEGSVREGFRGEGVKDIELNMLSIPIHLKYNFFVKNRWRLYALTGLSLQVAYQANYYTADQTGFSTPLFAPAPAPGPPPAPRIENNNLDLAKGFFEGGSFDENSYLTGNFGIGLDYYFTDRLSVIFQPTYQHSFNYFIDGIGPLHDRINTFSIISGIKVKL